MKRNLRTLSFWKFFFSFPRGKLCLKHGSLNHRVEKRSDNDESIDGVCSRLVMC